MFCSLLMLLGAMAQKTTVSGSVVDSATGRAIEGANVTAEGLSVVTNGDGYFVLKSDAKIETIAVSHVGYRLKRVSVDGLSAENQKIRLEPMAIQLREVLVVADHPRELVNAAIRKIPQNYSPVPELYRCFYRETAMKRQHYICVAEGVVDMYKTSYQKGNGRDGVAISKGRRLLSPKRSDTLSVKVLGGLWHPFSLTS